MRTHAQESACGIRAYHPGADDHHPAALGRRNAAQQNALATMRGRMIVFTVLILLLTVGGAAALLRRSILTPVKILTGYCNDIASGNPEREIPEFEGELENLAQSLKRVSETVKNNRIPGSDGYDGDGR